MTTDRDPIYHCYENESLTYIDELGVERYKQGIGKTIREYPTILPREALQDVCPVCSRALIVRHGLVVCDSGMCRGMVVEGTSQD